MSGGDRNVEKGDHRRRDVLVGRDLEIKAGRGAAFQVRADVGLERRNMGIVPSIGRQRQVAS
jgi:hypothetical protein